MSKSVCLEFQNNKLSIELFGHNNEHLKLIEKALKVAISMRGNKVAISGDKDFVAKAKNILQTLYDSLQDGNNISKFEVEAIIAMYKEQKNHQKPIDNTAIKTPNRFVTPYSLKQKQYVKLLQEKEMVFAEGPAGTGKTYLAVSVAVSMFINHNIEKIILSRPAVEAGERIGFLPGDMKEKVDPYMQPLYDALYDMLPHDKVQKNLQSGIFEIAPLAFMRGRTLKNAFIILDEAQNATTTQMKMFLTRLGEGSRMVINGDLSQVDLPNNVQSGLNEAIDKLKNIKEIGFIKFSGKDIVRHKLVAKIVNAYQKYSRSSNDFPL